jgi:hypothetical protein
MLAVVIVLAAVGAGAAIGASGGRRPANPSAASAHNAFRSARCRWWPQGSDMGYLGPLHSTTPATEAELSVCPWARHLGDQARAGTRSQ